MDLYVYASVTGVILLCFRPCVAAGLAVCLVRVGLLLADALPHLFLVVSPIAEGAFPTNVAVALRFFGDLLERPDY